MEVIKRKRRDEDGEVSESEIDDASGTIRGFADGDGFDGDFERDDDGEGYVFDGDVVRVRVS